MDFYECREIYVAARTALAEKQTAILAERQALVAQLQQFAMAGEDNQYVCTLTLLLTVSHQSLPRQTPHQPCR